MRNWLFGETRNFAKQPVSFAKQQNSFRIEFRETKSETSFAGNPSHRENCHTADWYSQRTEFQSGQPKAWTARRVSIRRVSGGWQSAVHWKADCQGDNIVVAVRGIWARSLAIEWNPATAILTSRGLLIEMSYLFEARLYKCKRIHRALFRPKLHVNGLIWHTISWYYTFKRYPVLIMYTV
jgi:hypothetical protein